MVAHHSAKSNNLHIGVSAHLPYLYPDMKTILLSGLLLASSLAFSQHFEWVRSGSGIGQDVGQRVTVDAQGNVYTTGNFSGKATFSGTLYTGNGIFDAFITKYDAAGNLKWLRSMGGIQSDSGYGIKTDSEGNVYVTGYFSEIAEFRDDAGRIFHLSSSGNTDIFLAKYDSSGNFIWAKKAGGQQEDQGNNITIDAQNNLFLTGYFSDRCYFGSKTAISNGNTDVFIARYDTAGNCVWVQTLGGSGLDKSFGVAVDSSGSSYITGFFYYSASLSNSSIVLNCDGLSSDIFVAKYDFAGNNEWALRIGGPYNDAAFGIAVDREENFYITGYFLETADFGDFTLDAYGYNDVFVAKYDSLLECRWAINDGGVHLDIGLDIGLDNAGNVYVAGTFDSIAFFGNETLYSVDYYDLFVAKYNDKGIMQWVRQAGGVFGDFALSLCVQDFDFVYVTGYYKKIATFGSIESEWGEESDIFVTRISYPVGIDNTLETTPALLVYPNPSDGFFSLQFTDDISDEAVITILDIHGKEFYRQKVNATSRTIRLRFDAQSAGIYFMHVRGEKSAWTERIAILR
ncbi:MAG: SBBP repeat-containing protein [Chitinophagales bacterium]|nr:SBBP repeat-containing protein [Chitinophagales bacterium]